MMPVQLSTLLRDNDEMSLPSSGDHAGRSTKLAHTFILLSIRLHDGPTSMREE